MKLDEIFTTGSSIMPQKRNPDTVEILQGKIAVLFAKQQEIQNIITKLISGYHREYQLIKKSFFEGVELLSEILIISGMLVKAIDFKKSNLKKAMTKDLYATEKAYEFVKNGMSFRDAYQKVKKEFFA